MVKRGAQDLGLISSSPWIFRGQICLYWMRFPIPRKRQLPRHTEACGRRLAPEASLLKTLQNPEASISGGQRWTAFGHLMDAMPMPILLIDICGRVRFVNRAFLNISADLSDVLGAPFCSLFRHAETIRQTEILLENVVSQRKPQFGEGIILIGDNEVWSRMNLRSIRFGNERSILAVIEDLTTEKRELTLNEKVQKDWLKFFHTELPNSLRRNGLLATFRLMSCFRWFLRRN